ncbi:MAG TPA: hypothetical protein VH164_05300 [Ktedonobacteraceae bacterium]|nr:hypothetical protein [Ktedonobacteraceae bacterium]
MITEDPDFIMQAHPERWDALLVTGSAQFTVPGDDNAVITPVIIPRTAQGLEGQYLPNRDNAAIRRAFQVPESLLPAQWNDDGDDDFLWDVSDDAFTWSPE